MENNKLIEKIFKINNHREFLDCCLEVFLFQYNNCIPYRKYVDALNVSPTQVNSLERIPFLPIRAFRDFDVVSFDNSKDLKRVLFESSATTGMVRSRHIIKDISIYERSFTNGFERIYGKPSESVILALLPSYLEREDSSLVYMMNSLINATEKQESGFYLYNHQELYDLIISLQQKKEKTILFGVTFALLDFIRSYSIPNNNDWDFTVIETGGMKGKGEEIERDKLHEILSNRLGTNKIHSEYGMCELLSQAYSTSRGLFTTPPWMKILIRQLRDPFSLEINDKKGILSIIDLANLYSCSFIETEDVGRNFNDGLFSVDGRIYDADRRGCNMLLE